MKILTLVGSYRKNGNTARIVRMIEEMSDLVDLAVAHGSPPHKAAKSVAEQGSVVKVQVYAEKSNSASSCTKLTLTRNFYKLLIILVSVSWLAGCAVNFDKRADADFEKMIGPVFDHTLLLHTDKQRYTDNDSVVMWIDNNTERTLYFPDQSFGVRAFCYDRAHKQWVPYDLGKVGDPRRKEVEPGDWLVEDVYYFLPTSLMKVEDAKTIEIRLLMIGYSKPIEQGGGERYGAYTDIEVSAR